MNDKIIVVPPYMMKLLDMLEASPPLVAGTAWTVTVAHDAWCPMSTGAGAACCCDPDVALTERPAISQPWN